MDNLKKRSKTLNEDQPFIEDLKSRVSQALLATGTRQVNDSVYKDLVYQSIEQRIEREPSVMVWEYHVDGVTTTIKIEFLDEETCLQLQLNTSNLGELQAALSTIDNYFIAKKQRS